MWELPLPPYSRSGMSTAFSVKGQMLDTSDFGGQVVSVATAQPCHYRAKAAINAKGMGVVVCQ